MTRLVSLSLGGTGEPWRRLGLAFVEGAFRFADIDVFVPADGEPDDGTRGWSFDAATSGDIDGIPTGPPSSAPRAPEESPLLGGRLVALDHVVVMTDDLGRTASAVERELGAQLRRTRDAGGGVIQGFHRLDNTVIEIVRTPSNPAGASLWGFVGIVDDLDAVVAAIRREFGSDAVSPPRQAVQAGRRIATVRSSAGLGAAVALMSRRRAPESAPPETGN